MASDLEKLASTEPQGTEVPTIGELLGTTSVLPGEPEDFYQAGLAVMVKELGAPPHSSHATLTSGRKFISLRLLPWPSQLEQRPPAVLKEKRPAFQPRMRASVVSANSLRMVSQKPT